MIVIADRPDRRAHVVLPPIEMLSEAVNYVVSSFDLSVCAVLYNPFRNRMYAVDPAGISNRVMFYIPNTRNSVVPNPGSFLADSRASRLAKYQARGFHFVPARANLVARWWLFPIGDR